MILTDKELQVFIHKISNLEAFNTEEINEIKNMNSKQLLIILIVLNNMYESIIQLLNDEYFNK